ncbi:MAG: AAA family ATPase [Blautia sp.]|nr:AAA family ATPase [Blautia sp.]MBR2562296.1 AAA family ATPase [Eubacterium sp.]
MSMKINKLEIENVKRVKAVKMEPSANGLTIIGGRNGEGKTSVLDAIAWALGGNTFRPSAPEREGSTIPPYLHIVMNNGLVVERKGKNSDLKVTDPSGQKAGQQLLDSFVERLALDLPKFMEANDKEKAQTLLNIIGVGDKLAELELQEKRLYQERLTVGRIADQKKKFADEQIYYPEAPKEPVSAADLIKEQQDILARNAERERWQREYEDILDDIMNIEDLIDRKQKEIADLKNDLAVLREREVQAQKTPAQLKRESTAELEESIRQVDEINRKVRANLDKDKAEDDARDYAEQYEDLTGQIEEVRARKKALLNNAELPLPDLTVEDGKLLYKGQQWDNMSGAEQLKVATAIVRKLNPKCGFVLIDKLEQMDQETLADFGAWLEAEGLQVIATRVSTGEECSIIIQDGYGELKNDRPAAAPARKWKEGEF